MTDDLDDLKSMMKAATPSPDAARKAANIALAQKNFADLQGSRDGMRPTSDRPKTGLISGVRSMLTTLTSRAGLTASTAIVAVGLVVMMPLGDDITTILEGTGNATASDTKVLAEPVFAEPVILEEAQATSTKMLSRSSPAMAQDAPAAVTSAPNAGISLGGYARSGVLDTDQDGIAPQAITDTETFANTATNPTRITTDTPVSTFSIDVDTASYSVIRNSLTRGQLPPKDAVRIEEMLNYFPYDHPAPADGAAFLPTVQITQTPWNPDTQLMQIAIQGAEITERPPLNLVFLIDTSGSMNQPNKLPLLQQSFRLMLGQLRPDDQVAIVTYAGSAGQVLAPTPASERSTILNALNNLSAGGGTAGQAGLQQAYAVAAAMTDDGDVNRVILATDGDFNVGLSDPQQLKDYIAGKRDTGTYLSVLGFGRGNLDDTTMQALAQNGNGQAAYIDTLAEAQKVLVDQLSGALYPIANDVKIQVEFNPATISEYRLIGYETRALRREDFNNDKVDAGDIGAGHQVTALYEITPVGSSAALNDPLRYDTATPKSSRQGDDEAAFLRLRHKAPGASTSKLIETPIVQTGATEPSFAAAIAGFGQLLRGGEYTGAWSYADAIRLATQTKGEDRFGYRAEAIQLMRLAESLSQN